MADIQLELRRWATQKLGSAWKTLRGTQFESLAIASVEPDGLEMTRAGKRFRIQVVSTVTGIAPVQAFPTTAAQWLLYNPSPTKTKVLDSIGVVPFSGTAGVGVLLWGALVGPGNLPTTPPVANATGVAVVQANAPLGSTGDLIVASAQTLAAAPVRGYALLAEGGSPNTAVLSVAAVNRDIKGKVIIPPLCGLALAVTSPAGTTPLFVPVGEYTDLEIENE